MNIHTDHNGVETTAILTDEQGASIDGHRYQVSGPEFFTTIDFQNGPVPANGVNGVTNEALLAILIHRTKVLDTKFSCDENKRAIQHMEEALVNLEVRSARRMVRGVEGKEVA